MALSTTNITTSLIKNTLNATTNDVGALCISNKINHWSKWKPMRIICTTLTDELIQSNNYGITILKASTPLQLLTLIEQNNNIGYKYLKPNISSGYRLGDFRNYNHDADVPTTSFYNDGDVVNIGNVSSTYSKPIFILQRTDQVNAINLNDIYPSMNRGIAFYDEDNNIIEWSTTTIPYGKRAWQQFANKEVKAIEFYTTVPANADSQNYLITTDDVFCAIPFPLHTITITSTTAEDSDNVNHDVYVEGTFILNADSSVCSYSFRFSSVGSNYVGGTLNNVVIKLSKDYNDSEVISYRNLGNITVGSEEATQYYSGTFSINTTLTTSPYVHIYWNNEKKFSKVPFKNIVNDEVIIN